MKVIKALQVSTEEISMHTAMFLNEMCSDKRNRRVTYDRNNWLMKINSGEKIPKTWPKDLAALIQHAVSRGCNWIIIDTGDNITDKLPNAKQKRSRSQWQ